jgi:hypothetical protein
MDMNFNNRKWQAGDIVALRYITTAGRIEMCWPCRIVEDSDKLLALFIAADSSYKAGPKKTATEKRIDNRSHLPPDEYVWRKDTLRIMQPGASHSVSLFWEGEGSARRFARYFVNMEEPFRRTLCGFDTQDHTLDVVVTPELEWSWRDEQELESHVSEKFYTQELADEARAEGQRVIDSFVSGTHPCLQSWAQWSPDPIWSIPQLPIEWSTTPVTHWYRRDWAYGNAGDWK